MNTRMSLARWFALNRWFPSASRWSEGLVRDLEAVDPKSFHKFLWEHHLDRYGLAYESADLFASGKLNSTTSAFEAFVEDLASARSALGLGHGLTSVLDIGCSVGHVLRAIETEVLPEAELLLGIDIDRQAIESGTEYLEGVGSKVQLMHGDLENLNALLGADCYEFSYAAGSLSYLDETDARRAVAAILAHTSRLVALVGLANPAGPNAELPGSVFRDEFGNMWTHNFAAMVESEGWKILSSRWDPPSGTDRQGLYSIFASPA